MVVHAWSLNAMSVMVVQSGSAGHLLDTADPTRAWAAVAEIENTGRRAMAAMRTLLGVLRDGETEGDESPRAPAPTLDDVRPLVTRVAQAGLPTILAVHGSPLRLGYQVAAGVAEAGRRDVPNLDAEAARVAYLVDGDEGGMDNARKLARFGVPEDRIVILGRESSGLCLEDLIRPDVYASTAEVARGELGHEPSKTEVAARLIDEDDQLLSPDMQDLLARLHETLSDALQIPRERRPQLTST